MLYHASRLLKFPDSFLTRLGFEVLGFRGFRSFRARDLGVQGLGFRPCSQTST